MNQDYIAWIGPGTVADRTMEHLGESDRGVILLRKRLLDDLDEVAAGRDPKGLIRDPARNHRVHLPLIPFPAPAGGPQPFVFLAGPPEEVFEQYTQAWHACAASAAAGKQAADG